MTQSQNDSHRFLRDRLIGGRPGVKIIRSQHAETIERVYQAWVAESGARVTSHELALDHGEIVLAAFYEVTP